MEKRFFMAMILSVLVLAVYSSLLPKTKHITNKEVTTNMTGGSGPVATAAQAQRPEKAEIAPASSELPKEIADSDLYELTTDGLSLQFSAKGGFLAKAYDKSHNSPIVFKNIGLVKEWQDYPFTVVRSADALMFECTSSQGQVIKKTFRVRAQNVLELDINISTNTEKSNGYTIFGGDFDKNSEKNTLEQRYLEFAFLKDGLVSRKACHGVRGNIEATGRIGWAGMRDRYFCIIVSPQLNVNKIDMIGSGGRYGLAMFVPEDSSMATAAGKTDVYRIYLGPQSIPRIKEFEPGAEQIVNYGVFDAISKAMLFLLNIFHRVTGSWGWAIVLITFSVYFLLFPLSLKSMISMRKMQALQPKMEELRAKFKDNPQKMNSEIMELYKREKVNPFGGCLPMLLQIPVFVALYQLLMRFISLKGASFGWIKDLSEPDRAIIFPNSIPFLGNELNILPILMAIVMFFQQKLSMTASPSASDTAAEQQKIMAIMMPVIFGFLFYKMPSALVLYWLINSFLMTIFQWKISRKIAK